VRLLRRVYKPSYTINLTPHCRLSYHHLGFARKEAPSSADERNAAIEQNISRYFTKLPIINAVERLKIDARRMGASEDFLFEHSLNRRMRKTGWHMTSESTEIDMRMDFSACRSKGPVSWTSEDVVLAYVLWKKCI
jgi:hypothetical protein